MYRTALRATPRRITTSTPVISNSRRFLSTAPPAKRSRSWKNTFVRWGLAGAGIYWYNTNTIFNGLDGNSMFLGQPTEDAIESVNDSIHSIQDSKQPTLDAIVAEKRAREAQLAEANKKSDSQIDQVAAADGAPQPEAETEGEGGLGGLEEEAGQQGAFNPETGEINWDCPCLGGMAHGPCGEEFKAAFSCFVYSNEEPKGVECIDKFKGMQDCFRQHPEMYGSELEDDEEEVEEAIREQQAQRAQADAPSSTEESVSKEGDSSAKSASPRVAPTSTPTAASDATGAQTTPGKDHEQETKSSNADWSSPSKAHNEQAEKESHGDAQK